MLNFIVIHFFSFFLIQEFEIEFYTFHNSSMITKPEVNQ